MKTFLLIILFIAFSIIRVIGQAFELMDFPVYPCNQLLVGITQPILSGKDALYVTGKSGLQIGLPGSIKWITLGNNHFHEIGWELGYFQRHYIQNISSFNNRFLLYSKHYGDFYYVDQVDFNTFQEGIGARSSSYDYGKFNINSIYFTLFYKSYFYGKWFIKPSFLLGVSGCTLTFPPASGYSILIVQGETSDGKTFNDVLEIDDLALFEVDGILGLGLDFSFGNCFRVMGFDVRYYYGFNSIAPKFHYDVHSLGTKKLDLKNRAFSFSLVLYIGDWFNN